VRKACPFIAPSSSQGAVMPLVRKPAVTVVVVHRWLRGLLARAHYNAVVVALAAKPARIAWATQRKGVSFERQPGPAHT
jgi:hypothetical protein